MYVGETVAMVVAETAFAAQDAADLVEVDYEPLDTVVTMDAAQASDAPQLWPEAPGNIALDWAGTASRSGREFAPRSSASSPPPSTSRASRSCSSG